MLQDVRYVSALYLVIRYSPQSLHRPMERHVLSSFI